MSAKEYQSIEVEHKVKYIIWSCVKLLFLKNNHLYYLEFQLKHLK